MATSTSIIQSIKSEQEDGYSDDSLFNIKPWGADLSFRELIERYDEDELVKPELQRNYVWDRREASRFIDSLLLGLPVPSIFLAQTRNEKLLIIDGFQRIMTVRDYVRGIFSKDQKSFALSRTDKINKRWRGKQFAELTDTEQRRIKNTTIHAIVFAQQKEPESDDTSLFQVFERINTSGRTLTAQEIRNCVAQGALNTLLFRLNEDVVWRILFGLESAEPRMRDMEFILRFFALSSEQFKQIKQESLSLKRLLDLYMKNHSSINDTTAGEMAQRFIAAIRLAHEMFGVNAFHNISPSNNKKYVPKFSPTIFDSILIAIDSATRRGIAPSQDPGGNKSALLQNDAYRSAIAQETMRKSNINLRIQLASRHLFGVDYE
ncbi:DUF262 domain-containing protein [Luteimonas sp. M1R5S18]|uniref:DUF262 domain-containing protein n=1 Tax=Luteimonas rhizosphaericola TaxID=3042024 RepID=A0ABT6JGK9_9GAMM|nr:DUF262 domain-containing protein [Luteimonas rhizosphaericola]MDH5829822.1 DUF262 domain-containing protein [Luteimonas rhizosphaericola]